MIDAEQCCIPIYTGPPHLDCCITPCVAFTLRYSLTTLFEPVLVR